MKPESNRPVIVEDLLRVKRAERPSEEFWTEFDQELRAKQLAALVAKRPWWRSLPTWGGLARYHFPLGAAAVLAVTLISIRDYRPSRASAQMGSGVASVQAPATANGSAVTSESYDDSTAFGANESDAAAAPAKLSSEATVPGELTKMIPFTSGAANVATPDERPSARSIAVNLAAAEAMLGTPAPGFEARALPAKQAPREPLAELTAPAESRRSRFAAAFASMSSDPSIAPSARVARRLSDEQLYDSIHRFGASGNSVSFRF